MKRYELIPFIIATLSVAALGGRACLWAHGQPGSSAGRVLEGM